MTARPVREAGAVLMVALVTLMVITLLTLSTVRLTMAAMRTAVNEELRRDAFQNAQSLIDGALAVPSNLGLAEPPGEANCLPADTHPDCARTALTLPEATPDASDQLALRIRRLNPEVSTPPRNTDYSAIQFQAALLQVESEYDQQRIGWGREELREGIALIIPRHGR